MRERFIEKCLCSQRFGFLKMHTCQSLSFQHRIGLVWKTSRPLWISQTFVPLLVTMGRLHVFSSKVLRVVYFSLLPRNWMQDVLVRPRLRRNCQPTYQLSWAKCSQSLPTSALVQEFNSIALMSDSSVFAKKKLQLNFGTLSPIFTCFWVTFSELRSSISEAVASTSLLEYPIVVLVW